MLSIDLQKRGVRLTIVLVASIGVVLVFSLSTFFSFRRAMEESRTKLEAKAWLWSIATQELLDNARKAMSTMARETKGKADETTLQALQGFIYQQPVFYEASLLLNGRLAATNLKLYTPPVLIKNKAFLMTSAKVGSVTISPPAETIRKDTAIIVNYNAGDNVIYSGYLKPQLLAERLNYADRNSEDGCYLIREDGILITSSSSAAKLGPPPALVMQPGFNWVEDGLIYVTKVGDYPLYAVAMLPKWVYFQNWFTSAPFLGIFGLVISSLLFFVAWRASIKYNTIENDLKEAAQAGQIIAHYQPIVSLATGRCVGAEALMRWHHPRRGVMPPLSFLHEAERCGLLPILTESLIKCVANDFSPIFKAVPDMFVSINITANALSDDQFVSRVERLISQKMRFDQLYFEIDGTPSLDEKGLKVLETMKSLGMRLGIDDFGTGYSNVRNFSRFQFNILKIDRAFVDGISDDNESCGLVDQIVAIGRACNLDPIAEGIEQGYQVTYLYNLGVEYGQGFLYARPMTPQLFRSWLATNLLKA